MKWSTKIAFVFIAILFIFVCVDKADAQPSIGKPMARTIVWDQVELQWRLWGGVGEYNVHSCYKGPRAIVHCEAEADGLDESGAWRYHCSWSATVRGHFRRNSTLLVYKHSDVVCVDPIRVKG